MSTEIAQQTDERSQPGESIREGWYATVSDKISQLFYPTYKRYLQGSGFSKDVERSLAQANYNLTVEIYLSRALGLGTLVGLSLTILLTTVLSTAGILTAGFPRISAQSLPFSGTVVAQLGAEILTQLTYIIYPLVFSAFIGVVVALIVFGVYIYRPRSEARRRSREIDMLMNHAVAFMYSLSVGGTNRIQVIQAIADAEDTYGEVSVAFQRIAYEMSYFNTDYQTAIENVAKVTPNDELEAFLTDMLSIINSGGDMTNFLETQHEMMQEKAQKKQEEMLDTIEFFGEMYLSLNILPLGLLIVLVIVSMIGPSELVGLFVTVYALIPALNLIFAVLVGTFKQDEPSDGEIDTSGNSAALGEDKTELRDLVIIDYYKKVTTTALFDSIRRQELQHRIKKALQKPWYFLRQRPKYVLGVTVPVTLLTLFLGIASGTAATSPSGFLDEPYTQTVIWLYMPVLFNIAPIAFFYEWNYRVRGKITETLTQDIRKLANANETGQPVLESIRIAAKGEDTLLSKEFRSLYKKAKFGTSLSPALVEFNNRYRLPRLARVVKLIQKAQESSSNITEVLTKASKTSQYQDQLIQERKARTAMQVAITGITFLVFLGVLLMLDVYFLEEMFSNAASGDSTAAVSIDLDRSLLSMLFFHAVSIQAFFAGGISGYMQTGKIMSGLKYITAYMLITLFIWGVMAT